MVIHGRFAQDVGSTPTASTICRQANGALRSLGEAGRCLFGRATDGRPFSIHEIRLSSQERLSSRTAVHRLDHGSENTTGTTQSRPCTAYLEIYALGNSRRYPLQRRPPCRSIRTPPQKRLRSRIRESSPLVKYSARLHFSPQQLWCPELVEGTVREPPRPRTRHTASEAPFRSLACTTWK